MRSASPPSTVRCRSQPASRSSTSRSRAKSKAPTRLLVANCAGQSVLIAWTAGNLNTVLSVELEKTVGDVGEGATAKARAKLLDMSARARRADA